MSPRTPLEKLSALAGIIPAYVDQTGHERRTTEETQRAILAAFGIDASTDDAARDAFAALRAAQRKELLAPVRVVPHEGRATVCVRIPAARVGTGSWRLDLETEDGERQSREGSWARGTPLELACWRDLPLGYHRLRLHLTTGRKELYNEQSLIVVPPRCMLPDELLGGQKAFGIVANLYTIRSRNNWGVGDVSDLATLAEWAGGMGADFVGVNPLHALLNRGQDISPYSPVSRLFRNPIYIDVLRVPELEAAPEIRERLLSPEVTSAIDALRESPAVRYEPVMAVKGVALDALHRVFQQRVRGSGSDRDRAYTEYLARVEPALTRFATWMTIADDARSASGDGPGARQGRADAWPAELRDPSSAAVAGFGERHAPRVDYHRWLQFELDRQLGDAARRTREAGMRIGLYQDLAIGTSGAGADAWAFPELFVHDASIGAPPDPYAANGQNWGLPPIDPWALRRQGYRYFIDVLRAGFRHAGALRIDHVMGLFRLFWIPNGMPGSQGAYVHYPADDLLGIVALESVRHGSIVVGEDLGTVPKEVPRVLERWGILGSQVLYFERSRSGAFRPPRKYRRLALATANTHDMPTLTGFWDERDIDIRGAVGLLPDEQAVDRARRDRDADRTALVRRLVREKVLPRSTGVRSPVELRAAVHAFLCRTPAQLVGLSLDDLAGEVEPVNVPGVGPDKYPSWTRKMREPLDVIVLSNEVRSTLCCDGRRG